MAFFTIKEIIDIVIMTLAVGFIFKDVFRAPLGRSYSHDPVGYHRNKVAGGFFNEDFKLR